MVKLICTKVIDCVGGAVRAVRYNVDGSYCLTSGSDKKIRLWNPKTGLLLKTYGSHGDEVADAVGSCDSCHIVSASLDKSIVYWDVSTGQAVRRFRGHAGPVNCVRFNENSSLAISGSKDHTLMCWDIRTRKLEPIQTMKNAKDCVTSVIVTSNKIIASSLDGCIRHYDLRAGELICDNFEQPITYIVQTKDEQCILAACLDNVLRLFHNDDGILLSEYIGHKAEDYHIECGIICNDSEIISGSTEGCIMIWNILESKKTNKIQLGSGITHSITTHPIDNEAIFGTQRKIHVFKIGNEDEEFQLESSSI